MREIEKKNQGNDMSRIMNGLPTRRETEKEEKKRSAAELSRRRKLGFVIGSVIVVLLTIAFVVYKMISSAIAAEASHIPTVVPAQADTVVVAPSSKEWWSNVTNMAPLTFGIHDLDPYSAGLNIDHLGYSRSVDTVKRDVTRTGPVRSVYIESPTEDDAIKVEKWLSSSKGGEGRGVYRSGNIVEVTYNWINSFEAPAQTVASRSDFSMSQDKTKGAMWVNFDNQVDALAGMDSPNKGLVQEYFQKTFALKSGTAWSGTSTDGVAWAGEYSAGGIDMALFDPDTIRAKLMGTQKEIGTSTGTVKALSNNLYSLVMHSGVKKTGDSKNNGAVEVPVIDPAVKNEKLRAAIQPSQWNAAVLGLSAQDEGVNTIAFSMSDSEMKVVFRYGATAKVSDMPAFDTAVPNQTVVPITRNPPGK